MKGDTYMPGRFGTTEIKNATTALQFVPAWLYRYRPFFLYKLGISICLFLTTQKSAARIAAIGARKMPRPAMKDNREEAEWIIFQGTMIHPAVTVVMITPRRILMYFGKREVMSLEQEMTFAERLVPIWATTPIEH
jgi:hypothetical protein